MRNIIGTYWLMSSTEKLYKVKTIHGPYLACGKIIELIELDINKKPTWSIPLDMGMGDPFSFMVELFKSGPINTDLGLLKQIKIHKI
jgi:hypothetical protein